MDAGQLHAYLLAQGYPVTHVEVGTTSDRATWRAGCEAGTAKDILTAVQAAIAAVSLPALEAADTNAMAVAAIDGARAIKALVIWTLTLHGGKVPTPAQVTAALADVRAAYRALG